MTPDCCENIHKTNDRVTRLEEQVGFLKDNAREAKPFREDMRKEVGGLALGLANLKANLEQQLTDAKTGLEITVTAVKTDVETIKEKMGYRRHAITTLVLSVGVWLLQHIGSFVLSRVQSPHP